MVKWLPGPWHEHVESTMSSNGPKEHSERATPNATTSTCSTNKS